MNILKKDANGNYVISEESADSWLKSFIPESDDCPMCNKAIWLRKGHFKACESCGLVFKLKLGDLL